MSVKFVIRGRDGDLFTLECLSEPDEEGDVIMITPGNDDRPIGLNPDEARLLARSVLDYLDELAL